MPQKAILKRRSIDDHIPEIEMVNGIEVIQDAEKGTELRICKTETEPCEEGDSYNYSSVSWLSLGVLIFGLAVAYRKSRKINRVKIIK